MLAESIRDVGTNEGLVATEAGRRGDLLEILDDVIGYEVPVLLWAKRPARPKGAPRGLHQIKGLQPTT